MQSFIFQNIISKFYNFYFSLNLKPQQLDISANSRCLLFTTNYEDAVFSCGGLLLQNAVKFEFNCMTNGFKNVISENLSYEEKIIARKSEFSEIMDKIGLGLYKIFSDIDDNRLSMRYDKFKMINIANFDYIFIPNITEQNRDVKSLIIMFRELLKEKPHKQSLKIVMYEGNNPLGIANSFVDITDVIVKKQDILKNLKSPTIRDDYADIATCLNKYRGAGVHKNYAEAYCVLNVDEFKKLTKILK